MQIPKGTKEIAVHESGAVQKLKPRSYEQIRNDFVNNSIFSVEQVITCFDKIEDVNLKINIEELFATYFYKIQDVSDFKIAQDSNLDTKINLITSRWPERISNILEEGLVIMRNKSPYMDADKLERVMALVRFKMQNSISVITHNSYETFTEFLKSFIPDEGK